MNLHRIHEVLPPEMEEALQEFERQFVYPLGQGRTFSIQHGPPYLSFFQAMGPASALVLEQEGKILGTLLRVERLLENSGEGRRPLRAHYLCDLKIAPSARGSRALRELMLAAREDILQSGFQSCFAVVMDGTGRSPTNYTGRLGIPRFPRLGQVKLLRLERKRDLISRPAAGNWCPDSEVSTGSCRVLSGDGAMRSRISPQILSTPDGRATGRIEDTEAGKRLWLGEGGELRSAHLSAFQYTTAKDGMALLEAALFFALRQGYPALFVSLPSRVERQWREALQDFCYTESSASIFGYDLPPGADWWIDTAEI